MQEIWATQREIEIPAIGIKLATLVIQNKKIK